MTGRKIIVTEKPKEGPKHVIVKASQKAPPMPSQAKQAKIIIATHHTQEVRSVLTPVVSQPPIVPAFRASTKRAPLVTAAVVTSRGTLEEIKPGLIDTKIVKHQQKPK